MSSPLDGRIRALAREEAAALLGDTPAAAEVTDSGEVTALKAEVAELRARLDVLEKASGQTARRTRKVGE